MAILNRAIRNAAAMMRSQEWGTESMIPPNSASGFAQGGPGVENAALSVSTVLACVKALHDDITSLPFVAFSGDRRGARQPLREQPAIVTEPFGPDLPVAAGLGQIIVSKAMRGNAYAFATHKDALGVADQLTVIHPDAVHTERRNGRKMHRIGGEWFGPEDVIHFTGMMLPGSVVGVDVVTAQRINLDLAMKVGQYAEGFFGGGGSPAGVVSVPGAGDRKKAREVRDTWEAGHAGVQNAHRPAVLFGGATWTPMSVTPENAQFLATRAFMREEICGWFSVPLVRIQAIVENAAQGGGKGLDALDAGYVKHGLLPMVTGIEAEFSRLLPGGQGSWTAFDFDEFLRASAEVRALVAQQHRTSGIRTIDEIRAAEGWAPLPNGAGTNPFTPLNSNVSPTGGADNAPAPGGGAQ
ncbi:MAG: phage portal protein [Mycobacteriaceae bacterium]